MINFLRGTLAQSLPDRVTIDVGGVGYEVFVPLSTYDRLPAQGATVTLLTHFHVREQEQTLYGFADEQERDLFRLLLHRVTGIGPKMGIAILSGMSVSDFQRNVVQSDAVALSKISGVGRKTAERIILELKDKVGVAAAWKDSATPSTPASPRDAAANDVMLALINLGYKQPEAQKALKRVLDECPGTVPDQGDLLRASLRLLSQS